MLEGVDLRLRPGELVGLLGPNGAGKTTLMRSILGLIGPAGGEVLVEGARLRPGRGSVGYVPQSHQFAWDFPISVEDAVMTGRTGRIGLLRRPGVEDWRAVDAALDKVRMTDLRRRTVGELSGGQRQRVSVARALALGSGILLLDEPFSGLDLPTQDLLTELFLSLAGEGRALLMSSHDILSAVHSCDRLLLLRGKIVAAGTPAELVAVPGAWHSAFGVSDSSPLMRALKAVA